MQVDNGYWLWFRSVCQEVDNRFIDQLMSNKTLGDTTASPFRVATMLRQSVCDVRYEWFFVYQCSVARIQYSHSNEWNVLACSFVVGLSYVRRNWTISHIFGKILNFPAFNFYVHNSRYKFTGTYTSHAHTLALIFCYNRVCNVTVFTA